MNELKPYINLQIQLAATETSSSPSSSKIPSVVARTDVANSGFQWRLVTPASWQRKGGVRGEVVRIHRRKDQATLYRVAFQMQVPSPSGRKLVSVSFVAIAQFPKLWNFDLSVRLRSRNIVPDDAPIVQACKFGNLMLARNLLQNGNASIRDVTKDLIPLLWVCLSKRQLFISS